MDADPAPVRKAALLWALGRVGLGVTALLAPRPLLAPWLGPSVPRTTAQVTGRALGGRDLVLGTGAAWMLARGGDARPWVLGCAAADTADAAATLLARRRLPAAGRRLVTVAAAGSALTGAVLCLLLPRVSASPRA